MPEFEAAVESGRVWKTVVDLTLVRAKGYRCEELCSSVLLRIFPALVRLHTLEVTKLSELDSLDAYADALASDDGDDGAADDSDECSVCNDGSRPGGFRNSS